MFNTSINLTATVLCRLGRGSRALDASPLFSRCDVQAALVLFPVKAKGAGHPQRVTLRVLPVKKGEDTPSPAEKKKKKF